MADEGLYGMIAEILEEVEDGCYLVDMEYDYKGYIHYSNMILNYESAEIWNKKGKIIIHENIVDVMPESKYQFYLVQLLTETLALYRQVNINSLNPSHGKYKEGLAKTIAGIGTIF